jgi:hypothetical protein
MAAITAIMGAAQPSSDIANKAMTVCLTEPSFRRSSALVRRSATVSGSTVSKVDPQ